MPKKNTQKKVVPRTYRVTPFIDMAAKFVASKTKPKISEAEVVRRGILMQYEALKAQKTL